MSTPIITFYSYKGGTGRSMGLANVAWILATNGHRVLAIDWDLEAPGLHRYFRPFMPDPDLQDSPGIIDLMWEYATAALDPLGSDEAGWHERLADISLYATSLDYPFPGEGTIDFVPAGRQDQLYPSLVSTFDWNNFYERLGGGGFLEALKRSMRGSYDYVLVDSRSGLSDTAGICTVQLPDVLVNCFSLSTQAIDGAAAVAESVHRQRADSIRMFPVPMRVEDSEQDLLNAGRDYVRRRLGQYLFHVDDPERYWGAVEVPYKGYYAYEEILATIGDRPLQDNTVLAAMERLVSYLTKRQVVQLGGRLPENERRGLAALFRHAAVSDAGRAVVASLAPMLFMVYDGEPSERFGAIRHLWYLLRQQGLNVTLDRPPAQRGEDWERWRQTQVADARLVIAVGSAPAPAAAIRVQLPGQPALGSSAVAVATLSTDGVRPLARELTARLDRALTEKPPDSAKEVPARPRAAGEQSDFRSFVSRYIVVSLVVVSISPVLLIFLPAARRFASDYPLQMSILFAVWLASTAALVTRGVLAGRFDRLTDALDRASGRRLFRYGRQYRRWVAETLRFADIKGLTTVGPVTPLLDEVFVEVSLVRRAPHQVAAGILADSPPDHQVRLAIGDLLQRERPRVLAVLGGPGSGKTTLLRHLAVHMAREPQRLRRSLPILLQARDVNRFLAGETGITLPDIVRVGLPQLPAPEPEGWWEQQIYRGRCVVLLDDLDEAATTDRLRLAQWIEKQMTLFPHNDYVVTSRPFGYRTMPIVQADVVQVQPFSDEQVRQLVVAWYRATEYRATGATGSDVVARADREAADLLARLSGTPALHDLAVNPLLLTMIVNVHRYRGALPGSRAALYREIIDVLLWRRSEAQGLPLSLPGEAKRSLLAELAFTMMRRRVLHLAGPVVVDVLQPELHRLSGLPAADLLRDITQDGLLVERERDLYGFVHLTFQEYLAATYIQENQAYEVLTANSDDAWWRETAALTATLGGTDHS